VGADTISFAHVGIVGAGTMGAGIATSCLASGLKVTLVDSESRALEAAQQRIADALDGAVRRGKLAAEAAVAARSRLATAREFSALDVADVVIEAVYENLALKQDIFRQLDTSCRASTLLATNTSTLDVAAIAGATARPQDVIGMHFFSPAHIMRLVEIVRGPQTSPASVARALALTAHIGKVGVVVGNCFGFVGNRMLYAYGRENQLLHAGGGEPGTDRCGSESFGMAMGPERGRRSGGARRGLPRPPRAQETGRTIRATTAWPICWSRRAGSGRRAGGDVFRYAGSRKRIADPEVDAMIAAESLRLGIARRAHSGEEIRERCLYALINEGARFWRRVSPIRPRTSMRFGATVMDFRAPAVAR
jgi:3-hydroxyacyl-CoA dehydrogenase